MVIIGGLVRSQPDVALSHAMPSVTDTVGVLLILKAFASGCSALTGVEAIANSVPQFRRPRAKRAQHTEVSLGVMLLGLGELIRRWHVVPHSGTTVLAQLTEGAVGHNALYYVIQLITLVLLALAANTSFGGLPVLAGLLAGDNFLFVGFTLSHVGMVRHWHSQRSSGWVYRAWINGVGAVLTFAATVIELVSKFLAGAWLVAIIIPLLVLLFLAVGRAYGQIGVQLGIGQVPPPPVKQPSLVVVPVMGLSRLTAEGISAALSLGDDVVAVTVVYTDSDGDADDSSPDASFREQWQAWRPEVPLITLRSVHRSLAKPIVHYLRQLEAEDKYHRLVVLIPEVQPTGPLQWLLHNQRGIILDRAIRRGTANVVLCRLRYRLETLAADPAGAADAASSR
ncbi:MAG: hypothetical protein ACXVW7_13275 [Trebonia sp.]